MSALLELHHGLDVESKLKLISENIEWARGWPDKKSAFWNAEAFMWGYKIDKEVRKVIEKELRFLSGGKNLDLGCGSFSYIPSVGMDLSQKMLDFNDDLIEKIKGDLEKKLPFSDKCFDSVTLVFVLNYVENYSLLLEEVKRVLKEKSVFMAVFYSKEINDWQRQKEVNSFSFLEWKEVFLKAGFKIDFYEKEGLWFFKCG